MLLAIKKMLLGCVCWQGEQSCCGQLALGQPLGGAVYPLVSLLLDGLLSLLLSARNDGIAPHVYLFSPREARNLTNSR